MRLPSVGPIYESITIDVSDETSEVVHQSIASVSEVVELTVSEDQEYVSDEVSTDRDSDSDIDDCDRSIGDWSNDSIVTVSSDRSSDICQHH